MDGSYNGEELKGMEWNGKQVKIVTFR